MDKFASNSRRALDPLYPPLPQSDRRSPSPDDEVASTQPKGIRMAPLTRFDSTRLPAQVHQGDKENDTLSATADGSRPRLRFSYGDTSDASHPSDDRSRLKHQTTQRHDNARDRSASPEAREYEKSGHHRVCGKDVQGHRSPTEKRRPLKSPDQTDRFRSKTGGDDEAKSIRDDRFRFKDEADDDRTSSHGSDSHPSSGGHGSANPSVHHDRFRFKDEADDDRTSSHGSDSHPSSGGHGSANPSVRHDRFRFKDEADDDRTSSHGSDSHPSSGGHGSANPSVRHDRFRFKDEADDDRTSSHGSDSYPKTEESSLTHYSNRLDRFRSIDSISPERPSGERVPHSPTTEHERFSSSIRSDRTRGDYDKSRILDTIRGLSIARRREPETPEYVRLNPVFMDGEDDGTPITKGIPFETIVSTHQLPTRLKLMQSMTDRNTHFMIKPFTYDPAQPDRIPEPVNDRYVDTWNSNYVRMPCSPSYYGQRRNHIWPLIERTIAYLRAKCEKEVATFETLAETLKRCAGHVVDLKSLEVLINEKFTDEERTHFMTKTLFEMCNLVLNVPKICSTTPPFLRSGSNASVTMSQMQAASLLACAFFLTYPSRSYQKPGSPCEHFPDPNFTRLYQGGGSTKVEKLRCILHYFKRVTEKKPTGVLTFRRCVLDKNDYPVWGRSKERLTKLHVTSGRKIEEFTGALQVDFANKYIGGGVLGRGCVQEEIRFVICPEMIVSLLLCERMEDNESIFLIGCEQYSKYTGYADSFKFAGDFIDRTPIDSWSRRCSQLVGMDAILYRNPPIQFEIGCIQRELIKAYVSFRPIENIEATDQSAIATGNWGCGAFNGDRRLKALIQLIAASEAGRPLVYAAYRDRPLTQELWDVYSYLTDNNATVSDVYKYLEKYSSQPDRNLNMFDMIRNIPIEQIRST